MRGEQTGTAIGSERFTCRPIELGRGEIFDHVHDARMANRMATLNHRAITCRERFEIYGAAASLSRDRKIFNHFARFQPPRIGS